MYHWTLAKWKVVSSVFFDTAVVDNDKYVVIEGNNKIEKKEVDLSLNNLGIPKWMMSDGDKITAFGREEDRSILNQRWNNEKYERYSILEHTLCDHEIKWRRGMCAGNGHTRVVG